MSMKRILRNASLKKASTMNAVPVLLLEEPSTSSTEVCENVSSTS